MLSNEVVCPLGLLGMPSWSEEGALSLLLLGFWFRRRGLCEELVADDIPCSPRLAFSTCAGSRRAELEPVDYVTDQRR